MKKNILSIGLILSLTTASLFGLTACDGRGGGSTHTHSYTAETTYIVEDNKAYTQTKCSCGESTKTEMTAGTYIIATPATAQLVLDGFATTEASEKIWNERTEDDFAPISNKTIVFSDGEYDDLFLRAGANPEVYETADSETALTKETELTASNYTYVRTISNTKFVGTQNAVFTGLFNVTNSAINKNLPDFNKKMIIYDTVRNLDLSQSENSSYYYNQAISLNNVSFENLTFNGRSARIVMFDHRSFKNSSINNITINNCNFLENDSRPITKNDPDVKIDLLYRDLIAAIMFESYDTNFHSNVTVTNCNINKYFLGIKFQGINNVTIKNNTLTNIEHNPIQVAGLEEDDVRIDNKVYATGNIVVENNVVNNTRNQAFKFHSTKDANITLKDNVANECGINGSDDQNGNYTKLKEVTSISSTTYSDVNNTFNGTKVEDRTQTLEDAKTVYFVYKENGAFDYITKSAI